MGIGASNTHRKTFSNPNINKDKETSVIIQLTPDVYERIQTEMLSSEDCANKKLVNANDEVQIDQCVSTSTTSSVALGTLWNQNQNSDALKDSRQNQNLELAIISAKKSLRELSDILPHEKGGVEMEAVGRPLLLEPIDAWNARKDKEVLNVFVE